MVKVLPESNYSALMFTLDTVTLLDFYNISGELYKEEVERL